MKLIAPAKVNWTLEVLNRRDDGYHEVRTLMQAVGLCDGLEIRPAKALGLDVEGPHEASEDDLVLRAAALLDGGRLRGAHIRLTKRIPVAAGLGGGSSDAAAALRGLNEVWGLGRTHEELARFASQIGSDVPFFLTGGTALAGGRGEHVTPLADVVETWLVLLAPPLAVPDKTKRMYAALTPSDFTDGSRTDRCVQAIREGRPLADGDLHNAFERAAYEVFAGLGEYREALRAAGARRVHLAGAGPALFALSADEAGALAIRDKVSLPDARLFVLRTLTAPESLQREG